MSLRQFVLATAALAAVTGAPLAAKNPMVGGAAMYPTRTIVANAVNSKDHTTLVAAVKAAGLVETLSGKGPFTVFAPTNAAFARLPAGTVETLVKPENKGTLTNILTYHVVSGKVGSADLVALIKKHGGTATIDTLGGGKLTARLSGQTIIITDAAGRATAVAQADVMTSNGVIHVTDGVFLPS